GGRLLFVPETDESPLTPRECLVQTPSLQKAWAALKAVPVPPSIEQLHLRSNSAGEVGLHAFVKDGSPGLEAALRAVLAACPSAVGLGATGRQGYRVVAGESSLKQTLGGATWLIPHNGFFQTNEPQAAVLLDLVRREAR